MNKLVIFDKADGINYIHPVIVNACRNFAERELFPHGMGTDLCVKVDYNTTIFSYIDNSARFMATTLPSDSKPKEVEPVPVICVKKNDWGENKSVVVFSQALNKLLDTEIYFKVTLERIEENNRGESVSFWKYKVSYCKDWFGDHPIAKEDIKFPIFIRPDCLGLLVKLKDTLERCFHLLEIEMCEKFDVITEEEDTENADNT